MKVSFLLLLFFISVGQINAQKIKIKKGIISVDKKQFLNYDEDYDEITLLTLDGNEIAIVEEYFFKKPRKKNPFDPEDWRLGNTIIIPYYLVSFPNFNLEFETDLSLKKMYAAFYEHNLIENGSVSKTNAKRIAALISKEISGDRPVILLSN